MKKKYKHTKLELEESERLYRNLFETMTQGVVYQDRDGMITGANPAAERILGLALDQMQGRRSVDPRWRAIHEDGSDFPGDDHPAMVALRTGQPVRNVVMGVFNPHEEAYTWININAVPEFLSGEAQPFRVYTTFEDITERRQALEQLRESEERFRIAFHTHPDAINLNRLSDGLYLDINEGFTKLTGFTRQDAIGKTSLEIAVWGDPADRQELVRRLREKGYYENLEAQFRHKTGRMITGLMSARLISIRGVLCILSVTRDITERKQAEDQIKKALAEKETLLRELYHRTRNNMSVIIALLELQASYFDDIRLREAFSETKNRIYSMALVHQKLYEAHDLSHVNLKEYISELAGLLMSSYQVPFYRVDLLTDVEDIPVLIDIALPCGLILNELITNAFKHAFPAGQGGQLTIQLHRNEGGEIVLRVADNGAGVPEGFDPRQHGRLGLLTVYSVGETQLNGKVTFDTREGFACQVQFRDDIYKARV